MKTSFSDTTTAGSGNARKKRKTRRLRFLPEIDRFVDERDLEIVYNLRPVRWDTTDGRVDYLTHSSGFKHHSIPFSNGRLSNLKKLVLDCFYQHRPIPLSIGELKNLDELQIQFCPEVIPPTIGRLRSLKFLSIHADSSDRFVSVPDAIGDLVNLEALYLWGGGIVSLPQSIGKLQNLIDLRLIQTPNFRELPTEIGWLTDLKLLSLERTGITSLPESIGQLLALEKLRIADDWCPGNGGTGLIDRLGTEYWLTLARRCRSLGCLGESLERRTSDTVRYALACNRARPKLDVVGMDEVSSKLWPFCLHNATIPYEPGLGNNQAYKIAKPDAVYRYLDIGRESFVCSLIHRNTT